VVIGTTVIDYSQPLVLAGSSGGGEAPSVPTTPSEEATRLLDAARTAFQQADYATALTQVNQALAQQSNDPVSHEFRGLVLFATGKYAEASAAIYAVLSTGPGWDWTTMIGFYADAAVYTQQLRALEDYRTAHPNAAEARFLLAYHYLTCGYNDAAVKELQKVVALNPKDQLSAQLLRSLQAPTDAEPAQPASAAAPAAASTPLTAASLTGKWQAQRPDGSSIALDLRADGQYTWSFSQQGKPREFTGPYTLADNLLILKQGSTPTMVGQVAPLGPSSFNFKLANDNPADPGLTFSK